MDKTRLAAVQDLAVRMIQVGILDALYEKGADQFEAAEIELAMETAREVGAAPAPALDLSFVTDLDAAAERGW